MKIVEKCPTMEQFDRIVNRWKEQLIQGQTDTNELVSRLRDFVQTEVDINRIKSNRWIPCYERLPEHYNEILFCERDRTIHKGYMYWDDTFIENYVKFRNSDIVAWMPLPKPPESEV